MSIRREIRLRKEFLHRKQVDINEMIKKASPDFIEVKGFMSVGEARKRKGMDYSDMPRFNEVKDFARKIAENLKNEKYKILDEHEFSNVILIGKDKKRMKIKKSAKKSVLMIFYQNLLTWMILKIKL